MPQVFNKPAEFYCDITRSAAPTSGGTTQSFTFSATEVGDTTDNIDNVRRQDWKGFLIWTSGADTNNTSKADAIFSMGACVFGDPDTQMVTCGYSEDNVSTSNAWGRAATDKCVMILDNTGAVDGEANFNDITIDADTGDPTVTIDWTSFPTNAVLVTMLLIGGDKTTLVLDQHDNSGSQTLNDFKTHTLSGLGGRPSALIFLPLHSNHAFDDTARNHAFCGLAFAARVGPGQEQAGQGHVWIDNLSTTAHRAWRGTISRCFRRVPNTTSSLLTGIQITDMDTGTDDEYETKTLDVGGAVTWGVVGIHVDSTDVDFHVEQLGTNGGTGLQTWSSPAHTPVLTLFTTSLFTANQNTYSTNNQSGGYGVGAIAEDGEAYHASWQHQRNVTTTNTNSFARDRPVEHRRQNNTTGHSASWSQKVAGSGHEVNWSAHVGAGVDVFAFLSISRGPTVVPPATRRMALVSNCPVTTSGLQADYDFQDGSGSTVSDVSGVGSALDLTIETPANVTWVSDGLQIDTETRIDSQAAATKIIDACQTTDEISIEIFCTPSSSTQASPARMVVLGPNDFTDTTNTNFMVGQGGESGETRPGQVESRMRTDGLGVTLLGEKSGNGLETGRRFLENGKLSHVVVTFDSTTTTHRIYVDGVLEAEDTSWPGDFDNWASTYWLCLANENFSSLKWLGTFHRVRIYDQALTLDEIKCNFHAFWNNHVPGCEPVTPLDPPHKTLRVDDYEPDVVIPVLHIPKTLQIDDYEPDVPVVLDPPHKTLQIDDYEPDVVIPVLHAPETLQLVDYPPAVPTIVDAPHKILQIDDYEPDVVLPVLHAPEILRIVEYPPAIPTIVDAPHKVLRVDDYEPDVVVPVLHVPETLQIDDYEPDVAIPVLHTPETLQIVEYPPAVPIIVDAPHKVLRVDDYEPDIVIPVLHTPETLRLVDYPPAVPTIVDAPHKTLRIVSYPPMIFMGMIEVPASILQLVRRSHGAVTPPEPPVSTLRIQPYLPTMVGALLQPPTATLQIQPYVPAVPTIVDAPHNILRLQPYPPDVVIPVLHVPETLQIVDYVPSIPTITNPPHKTLRLVATEPDIVLPVLHVPATLRIVAYDDTIVIPTLVVHVPDTLRLQEYPPGVPAIVTHATAGLRIFMDPDNPQALPVTPVEPPVSTLRLQEYLPAIPTVVDAPHSILQIVNDDGRHLVFTPIPVPAATLRLQEYPPDTPPTLILPPANTLQLQPYAPNVVTPIVIPANVLRLQPYAPMVLAPLTVPAATLQLQPYAPAIQIIAEDQIIQVPASTLLLTPYAPSIISGQGCYEWIHNMLRTRFQNLVQEPQSLATIYDNDPEDVPEDTVWARFRVKNQGQTALTSGTNGRHIYRKTGVAQVTVYLPLAAGDKDLLVVADAVDAAFRDQTDHLRYFTPSLATVGRDGRWWAVEITCPWLYDEVRPAQIAGGGFALPDFEALHNAVRSRFETLVETPESVVTVYDNDPQDPPEDALWVRWSVRPGDSFRAENGGAAGSHRYRTPGVAVAQIFSPLREGDKDSLALVDVIVPAFRGVTASGVTYRTPRVENIGRDGRWWQTNVVCPFFSDDIA